MDVYDSKTAPDLNKKFIVKANGLSTEVLGIHFNANSYPDGNEIKVALMEGSVKVFVNNGFSSTIKTGEHRQ